DIADMKNSGDRYGGSISAALFLREFIGDKTWAHIDMAGPIHADKDFGHVSKGATGFGVATLVELLSPR
ncbi:MAG TPA: leucyl aminopeptidase, partial [Pseudomonadota bacterium]|nr:leucyl aminopeptidase [Pseudomonadota bacterium]